MQMWIVRSDRCTRLCDRPLLPLQAAAASGDTAMQRLAAAASDASPVAPPHAAPPAADSKPAAGRGGRTGSGAQEGGDPSAEVDMAGFEDVLSTWAAAAGVDPQGLSDGASDGAPVPPLRCTRVFMPSCEAARHGAASVPSARVPSITP